jgi:hypothetical protein
MAKFFKIDVDGYDCAVIRGAHEYLIRAKPVIFFEYDPHALAENGEDGLDIFGFLYDRMYGGILVYDNFGIYVGSSSLLEGRHLADLNRYCGGRESKMYYDMVVFNHLDNDLFNAVRRSEEKYFDNLRK